MKANLISLGVDQSRIPEKFTLTPAEQDQLKRVQEHIRLVARHNAWDKTPEGSINAIIRKCSPRVQETIRLNQQLVREADAAGYRKELFQPKKTIDDLGLDKTTRAIMDRAETEDAISGIHERMGTAERQSEINDRPADLREQLSAAFDTTPSDSEGGTTD